MTLSGRVSPGTCVGQRLYAFIHESTKVSIPLICLLPVKGMCQCAGAGFCICKGHCAQATLRGLPEHQPCAAPSQSRGYRESSESGSILEVLIAWGGQGSVVQWLEHEA